MYVNPNFPTKKALKDAVAAGRHVTVFEPGIGISPTDGWAHGVEGPHGRHTWYASVKLEAGRVVSVK